MLLFFLLFFKGFLGIPQKGDLQKGGFADMIS